MYATPDRIRRVASLPLKLVAKTNICATMAELPSAKALSVAKPYCKIKSTRNRFEQSVFPSMNMPKMRISAH